MKATALAAGICLAVGCKKPPPDVPVTTPTNLPTASAPSPSRTGIVFGRVHIRAVGDTGREKFEQDQSSTTFREESIKAQFDLTFGRDSSGNPTGTISATQFEHKIEYQREFSSMPGTYRTTTETHLMPGAAALRGPVTVQIVMAGGRRRLLFSFGEPSAQIEGAVTTISAYGLSNPQPKVSPVSAKEERLFLDLDWSRAQWQGDFSGSISSIDRYYIDPCTKRPWLTIDEDWELSPTA